LSLSNQHRRIPVEPKWRPRQRFTNIELPSSTRRWLLDDGSLTAHLRNLGELQVHRLYQGWQVPLPSEQLLLAQSHHALALVREVELTLDGQPVVFARSVFPSASLTGSLTHLRRLQNSSLGDILFRHPGMHRSPFEVARLAGNTAYLPEHLRQSEMAWGRRSKFEIEGRGLMVSEVFLAPFTPWKALSPVHRAQRGKVNAAILRPKH
jgi:chorismate lyase